MKKLVTILAAASLLAAACSSGPSDDGASGGLTAAEDNGAAASGTKSGKQAKSGGVKAKAKTSTGTTASTGSTSGAGSGASSAAGGGSASSSGAATASGTQAASPAPADTYNYDTDGTSTTSGESRPMPKVTTLEAQAPQGGVQTRIRDLRDEDGVGSVTETRLVFKPDGVYLAYVKVTTYLPGGLTDVREFKLNPPELIAPTGAGPGASTSFRMQGSGTTADVTIRALRYESITIGGEKVRSLVVDTKIVFSGALEGEQKSTTWFLGKYLLQLKEKVKTDVTNGPIRAQSDYEAVLQQLP